MSAVPTVLINSVQYDFASLEAMSGPGQVALYNLVTGEDVKKFSDRKTGAKRLWALGKPFETKAAAPVEPAPKASPKSDSAPKKAPAKKAPKPARAEAAGDRKVRQMTFRLPPKGKTFLPHREGTNRAKLIQLLSRQNGATFEECREACDWDKKTTYEGIRLLNALLGYGLFHKTQKNGEIRIWLVTSHEDFRERVREAKANEE